MWGKKVAEVCMYVHLSLCMNTCVYMCNYTYVNEKEMLCVNTNGFNLSSRLLLWEFHSYQQLENLQFLKNHCQIVGIFYNFNYYISFQVKSITLKYFFIDRLALFTRVGKADIKGLWKLRNMKNKGN